MNAKLILFGATIVGAMGGYAWSALSSASPATARPARVAAAPASAQTIASADSVPVATTEDRTWATGGGAAPTAPTAPSATQRRSAEQSVYYAGCNEVRALGKAPLYSSQPGYRLEMDGDGDGVACEPIPANQR